MSESMLDRHAAATVYTSLIGNDTQVVHWCCIRWAMTSC